MSAKRRSLVMGVVVLGAVVGAGCSDSTNPAAGSGQNVALSFSGVRPPGVGGVMAVQATQADSFVLLVGADRLVITSAEVVMRKLELRRAGVSVSCDSVADEDSCEEFTIGAMLVSLPLAAGAEQAISVPVDSGTYTKIEFKIHKPGSDSVDQAFFATNPTWPSNTSIRVTGTFNGTPFTYTSSLDAEQEYTFNPPLVIDASGSPTNLTIRLDLSSWFRNGSAGPLVSPASGNAGGANESLIKDNIKNSIKAFEDHDHDGDERDG
jgi:hypothetical protein